MNKEECARKDKLLNLGFRKSRFSDYAVFGYGAVIEINENSFDIKISSCPDETTYKIISILKGITK